MDNNLANKKFISISGAAKFLGISADTLRNWESQGKITVSRTSGGARRYSRFELLELKKEIQPKKRKRGLLSVSKTAKLLDISPDTIRNWEARGIIDGIRTKGGARRFSRSEILRLQFELGIESRILTKAPDTYKISKAAGIKIWPHLFKFLLASFLFVLIIGSALGFLMFSKKLELENKTDLHKISLQEILGEQAQNLENQVQSIAYTLESLQKQFDDFQSQTIEPVINIIKTEFVPPKDYNFNSLSTNNIKSLSFSVGDIGFLTGSGSPEGNTGEKGDYYFRNDASGAADALYLRTPDGWISLEQTSSLQDVYQKGNEIVLENNRDIKITLSDSSAFRVDDGVLDTTPFIIDSDGSVGVGVTNPSSKVHISDDRVDSASGLTIQNNSSGISDVSVFKIVSNVGGTDEIKARIDTDGDLFLDGTIIASGGADLAEEYHVLDDAADGDLVVLNGGINVKKSFLPYQNELLGVISGKAGFILGLKSGDFKVENPNPKAVALNGRVLVNVSNENGPIEVGDYLTSSSTPGVAMKSKKPGPVIGKALEPIFNTQDPLERGKIMVFVNTSYADPQNFFASLSLDEFGNFIIPKLKVEKLTVTSDISTVKLQANQISIGSSENPDTKSSSDAFYDISGKIASLSDQIKAEEEKVKGQEERIKKLEEAIAESKESTESAALASTQQTESSASGSDLNLTPPDILLATQSATLVDLTVTSDATVSGMLSSYDFTSSNLFKSLGQTKLGNTDIAGDLTLDGTLSLEKGSEVNVIGSEDVPDSGVLYLQRSKLAQGLDIFDGKVIISKDGIIKAQVVVAGEFKTVAGKISGSANIETGKKVVEIQNPLVKKSSRILITPTTETNLILAVTEKIEGEKFIVVSSEPVTKNTEFDYFLISEL